MAKRYIDSNLFESSFVRSLKGPSKLLWIYLFCKCDYAGIWRVDYELASLLSGFKIDAKELEKFGRKLIFFDEGRKIFIPDFIFYQYVALSENNQVHRSVIKELDKYHLLSYLENNKEDLVSPLAGSGQGQGRVGPDAMDKDKDKDKDKEKKSVRGETKPESSLLFSSPSLKEAWDLWLNYKKEQFKFTYKPIGEKGAFKELMRISEMNYERAIQLIEYAIAHTWQGFYLPKEGLNDEKNKGNSGKIVSESEARLRSSTGGLSSIKY